MLCKNKTNVLQKRLPGCCVVDCCEIFHVEFPRSDCSLLLTNSVEFSAASLLSSACTSHIVRFVLKVTAMASHAAEITADTKIN